MAGQIAHLRADPSVVHRDVTISRDDRDELAEIAEFIARQDYKIAAGVLGRVVDKWDANEATEILVTEKGIYGLDGIGERCACGRALGENGEHDGGYGAHCG